MTNLKTVDIYSMMQNSYVCNSQVKSSTKKDEINDIQFSSMHRIRELKDEVASLLKRNVVHEPLKNVNKDDTKFSDWLFKGIELHERGKSQEGEKRKVPVLRK